MDALGISQAFLCGQEGSLARTAKDFARAGFAVFTFDYRSFGESGGISRQVISIRDQHQDWHAAIAHVRILVMGIASASMP